MSSEVNIEKCWVSHPDEWQYLFKQWYQDNPAGKELHVFPQYEGTEIVGLTVGLPENDSNVWEAKPVRLLVTVPHAHEPAGTAVSVDTVCELITGKHLDNTISTLPRKQILDNLIITFIPDTNPAGRSRSPHRIWDGSCENEVFYKHIFGITHDDKQFPRVPEWRFSEYNPKQIGLIFEKISEDGYVEPNTNHKSTHSQAIDQLFANYRYTNMLDMHQHERLESIHLPANFRQLSTTVQQPIINWAIAIIQGWKDLQTSPREEPIVPYEGQERQQFFLSFWEGRCPGMIKLTSEVHNNKDVQTGEPATMDLQWRTAKKALISAISHFLPKDI